ncbi:MAG: hypothetical protein HGB11_10990 [Chlorobiales bacterium]|nr:hypothetical protein [Chlorobiales bacterium]
MRLGLTVWFDAEGGKSETFGIHYPLAQLGGMMMPMGQRPESGMQGQDHSEQPSDNMQKPPDLRVSDKLAEEVEIVGENKADTERMRLKQLTGINLGLGKSAGSFVYEVKIPLQKDTEHPYAIGYDNKTPIGIGIKTGKLPDEESGRPGGMGGPPSGLGGGSAGMGAPPNGGRPPMGGCPGGRQSSQSDDDTTEIDLWLKASLN